MSKLFALVILLYHGFSGKSMEKSRLSMQKNHEILILDISYVIIIVTVNFRKAIKHEQHLQLYTGEA